MSTQEIRTLAQRDLDLAARLVKSVPAAPDKTGQIYGGLCHQFPVMVRTCGLCQAVAFSEAKAKAGEDEHRKRAHQLLLDHVAQVLAIRDGADGLLPWLRQANSLEYLYATRRVLAAWIYFKRFAESILKIAPGQSENR